MLAIARVVVTSPRLVLMDEPSEGLAPVLVEEIKAAIKLMCEEDISILLVEQNSNMALGLSKRAYIMEKGVIRYEGESKEFSMNPDLLNRYLGVA